MVPVKTLAVLSSFLGLGHTSPVPEPKPGVDPADPRNYCSYTGQGFCNFWIGSSGFSVGTHYVYPRAWKIFDSSCNEIGQNNNGAIYNGWFSLTSQLKYTVELYVVGETNPKGGIWYAGHYTDFSAAYCLAVDEPDVESTVLCRVAFQCVY